MSVDPEGRLCWDWKPVEAHDLDRVARRLRDGLNPNQIARELGTSKTKAVGIKPMA